MKTYTTIPKTQANQEDEILALMAKVKNLLETEEESSVIEKLYNVFNFYFPLDYLILRNPDKSTRPSLFVYPPVDGKKQMPLLTSDTQSQPILHSRTARCVRVGTQDDDTILIHSLHKTFILQKYSLMFLRDVVNVKHLCQVALISKYQDIYNDFHVAMLFALGPIFSKYWKKLLKENITNPQPELLDTQQFLSLDSLPGMKNIKKTLYRIARGNYPVLLLGETGTGKEVIANEIHSLSARAQNPFIKLNCGSIPDSLIDSELFGHEKGAFTGAMSQRKGRFERAHRGMLMLDELGELPMTAQLRLLRVLQENVIERVGGEYEIPIDVRIIAATHRNLPKLIQEGKFRQDLFYRLNVFPIFIPPLRERKEDILILVNYFIKRRCIQDGVSQIPTLSQNEINKLYSYDWPGNIRELQNVIEHSIILWDQSQDLTISIQTDNYQPLYSKANNENFISQKPSTKSKNTALDDVIKQHIIDILEETKWRINGRNGAADLLNINPSTLRAKMKKLGIF